jgi:hypothetical protein
MAPGSALRPVDELEERRPHQSSTQRPLEIGFVGSRTGDTLSGSVTMVIIEPSAQGGSASFPVPLAKR